MTRPGSPLGRPSRLVLDTSALVAFPELLDDDGDPAELVVPLCVVEELDGLKRRQDDVGWAARSVLRRLEALRDGTDLRQPVELSPDRSVRVETNGTHLDEIAAFGLDPSKPDNRILGAALGLRPCTLVSNDAALRIKAAQLGVDACEHRAPRRTLDAGWETIEVPGSLVDAVHAGRGLDTAGLGDVLVDAPLNRFAVLHAPSQSALVRRVATGVRPVRPVEVWGLKPRSKEQRFALDLLCDESIDVVALDGVAGTGKTIVALAAGLEQVVETRRYRKLTVFRPVVPLEHELGFLPGDVADKLDPWMAAISDALEALSPDEATARTVLDDLRARGQLSTEAVTFLRGRTLANAYIVVDEAQNLSPAALKTILTRAGNGTKVVLTGDCSQIDQPYLSATSNALAVVRDRFAGHERFGWLTLTSCERSPLARLAAELL